MEFHPPGKWVSVVVAADFASVKRGRGNGTREYMCVCELLKIAALNPPKKISILSCVFPGLTE